MNSFKALVKREYWEHKGAIFFTPAIIAAILAGLMLIGAIFGEAQIGEEGVNITFAEKVPMALEHIEDMSPEIRSKGVQTFLNAPVMLFGGVLLVICLFYALGCLYDERKDRSILFWKSLPVSDTTTVLSKFVAISLLVPVSYFVVISLFQLYLLVFATVIAWFGGNSGLTIWASSNLFSVFFNSFLSLIIANLWMAPFWGWLMLASSWAKKVAFLWAGLPIVMVTVAEGWLWHTTNFIEIVSSRAAHAFKIQNSNFHNLTDADVFDANVMTWDQVLVNSEFWVGLVVAAIFIAAAIYTRRYRDES